jgi:hypothetical protein
MPDITETQVVAVETIEAPMVLLLDGAEEPAVEQGVLTQPVQMGYQPATEGELTVTFGMELDHPTEELVRPPKPKKHKKARRERQLDDESDGVDPDKLRHMAETINHRHHRDDKPAPRASSRLASLLQASNRDDVYRDTLGITDDWVPPTDGQNVINIGVECVTELGKMLDMTARVTFTHTKLGPFTSVMGFWNYLFDGDDYHRTDFGGRSRETHRKMRGNIHDQKWLVADATWMKVVQNNRLCEFMAQSELPFDMYFMQDGIQRFSSDRGWYVRVLEEIRVALKAEQKLPQDASTEELQALIPSFDWLRSDHQRDDRRK